MQVPAGEQSGMARFRHTVAWIKTPAQELAAALAGSAEPVPPAYRINGEPEFKTSNGQLAARHDA